MQVLEEVLALLDPVLGLNGRSASFTADTYLLGAIPELDSMAVVAIISALEDRFGISVDDNEISAETFTTVGSVVNFVNDKVSVA